MNPTTDQTQTSLFTTAAGNPSDDLVSLRPATSTKTAAAAKPRPATTTPDACAGLLDVTTVAAQLGVPVRFVRRLIAERRIRYIKVGRYVRIHPGDLNEWVAAHAIDQSLSRGPLVHQAPRAR